MPFDLSPLVGPLAAVLGTLCLIMITDVKASISRKAERDSVEAQFKAAAEHRNKNEEHIGKLYSQVRDALEDMNASNHRILQLTNEHHAEILRELAKKMDRNECLDKMKGGGHG